MCGEQTITLMSPAWYGGTMAEVAAVVAPSTRLISPRYHQHQLRPEMAPYLAASNTLGRNNGSKIG